MVETLLGEMPYSLLNTVSPTHLHLQTGTLTCVDLSIVSYPVLIEVPDRTYTQCPSKFIFDCADWSKYRKHTICDREAGSFPTGDTAVEYFVSKLLESANLAIPQTKGSFRVKRVPCWNGQLSAAVKEKKKAARRYHRTLLVCDKVAFNRSRARVRYLMRQSQQQSWKNYVDIALDIPQSLKTNKNP